MLEEISCAVEHGERRQAVEAVKRSLDKEIPVAQIVFDGLVQGMNRVCERFRTNEIFVPEVLISARAMQAGIDVLKSLPHPVLPKQGTMILGTVKGDLHDIGKNLVKLMVKAKGIRVIDLGVDVEPRDFVAAAIECDADIIACSALLTTTMPYLEEVVKEAEDAGVRERVAIMVGGAPVTEAFCKAIGADYYTNDAASAAARARRIVRLKRLPE